MARPLRLERPGAVYHLSSLGNAGQPVFRDAEDSELFLDCLGQVCARFDWRCLAYCLLPDRYFLLVETRRATLSRGMRQINGRYTQAFNRRHGIGGHVFQGRYRAVMVESPGFEAAVCRDLLRQPVELGLAEEPDAWRWSSLRALLGRLPPGRPAPEWLDVARILNLYDDDPAVARRRLDEDLTAHRMPVWEHLQHQIFLGSETFAREMRNAAREAAEQRGGLGEFPKAQWQAPPLPLEAFFSRAASREEAMAQAYLSGAYSQSRIARHLGVHYSTVSRAVRRYEKTLEGAGPVISNGR